MSAEKLELRLARLQRTGVAHAGVPLCMLPDPSGLYDAWNDAHEETERAWEAWRSSPGREAACAYRAAAEREDCAQERLADHHRCVVLGEVASA